MSKYVVKLRKDGALNLPVKLRKLYGFRSGSVFEIQVIDGHVEYAPKHMMCPVCGTEMKLGEQRTLLDTQICKKCDKDLANLLTTNGTSSVSGAIKELMRRNKKSSVKIR